MPAPGDARAAVAAPALELPKTLERSPVRVAADDSVLTRIEERGEVWRGDASAIGSGITATADGALAAGLSGVVTSDIDADRAAGRATATCVSPASSWWFVGAGSSVGRADTLVLTNASTGVAVVDLGFYGPEGRLEDVDSEQIALEPGAQEELPLADFVPGVPEVAVEVTARQGRVAAALSETRVDAFDPAGADFIGAAASPSTETVLTGLPPGRGRRDLVVVNTGESETVVEVEVLGATGAFEPADFDVLRVPPGAVVTRDVGSITRDEVSGLRLRADQPVTASVRSTLPGPSGPDVSYAPAGVPLTAQAAAPVPREVDATVVLSALGESPVTAEVTAYDAAGDRIGRQSLELGAGQTTSWPVRGDGRPASFVVSSGQGQQLTGSVRWEGDGGESVTTLLPLRTTLSRPPLTYDPVGQRVE